MNRDPHRGEVWWADLPGDERRPVLVLTRDAAIPVLNRVLIVPATRTIRDIPTEVLLDQDDGMETTCALSFDNVTVVAKASLTKKLTELGPQRMAEVCRSLRAATGC